MSGHLKCSNNVATSPDRYCEFASQQNGLKDREQFHLLSFGTLLRECNQNTSLVPGVMHARSPVSSRQCVYSMRRKRMILYQAQLAQ